MSIEISAVDFTPKSGGDLLARFGAVLVRGLYPRDWILKLGSRIDHTYALLGALKQRGALGQNEARWLDSRSFQVDLLNDSDESIPEKLAAPIIPLAEATLDGQVTVSPFSFVRRVEPNDVETGPAHRLPFHQDQQILKSNLINVWTPFCDCGVTAPSLEIAARRLNALESNQTHDRSLYGQLGVEISADHVVKNYGDALIRPTLWAGDALIFLGTTIHRTHIAPGMSERRDSVDLRLTRC